MDIIAKLLRTADAYEAEARRIRAARRGGEEATAGITVQVTTEAVIERVRFSSAATTLSPARLTEDFWRVFRAAVRDAERATVEATPVELRDAEAAEIVLETSPDDEAGARQLPRPTQPTPWTDQADLWPEGIPDGAPVQVMADLKAHIQRIVDDADAVGPAINQLRGHGEHPAQRPTVRAEVTATGVPTQVTFTAQAQGSDTDELADHVLAALQAAKDDVAEQAEALWRQAGMTGRAQDPYTMHHVRPGEMGPDEMGPDEMSPGEMGPDERRGER
ncbi:hypothetical protein [Aestuariimicrobium ganziense]|uniref:hypothetical protein n=1 Tax=Aestuariimicrobium ganziense TaxID=2773677 RepID=UPI00194499ED|nr:hypothetical protein [Aestuariimicrobium ganziense]